MRTASRFLVVATALCLTLPIGAALHASSAANPEIAANGPKDKGKGGEGQGKGHGKKGGGH